jgi:FlaA1/EpsC-like NDP-sugar epimerase
VGDIRDLASARPTAVDGHSADRARSSGVPSPEDLFSRDNLAILLGRPLRAIPTAAGRDVLAGARVLVTGAAGSVGSALIARLLPLAPELVVAADIHEASLFRLARDAPPGVPLDLRVVDVRNEVKLRRLFAEVRPRVVFHLAAYKHVPFGEREADEPISVNVLGTDAIARVAAEAGVAHVVYPSSDKAVNPPSVYGATKRLAETLLLARAASSQRPSVHVVRYVNILGSSGSVLETFAAQVQAGLPLTLTDPAMTRYWMAMDEAVDLLIHALGLPSASRILLDAGEATPVKTMAERLYRILRPDIRAPEFVVTGARPGERLAEELASASESLTPADDGVLQVATGRSHRPTDVDPMIQELARLFADGEPEPLRTRLMDMAQSLQ